MIQVRSSKILLVFALIAIITGYLASCANKDSSRLESNSQERPVSNELSVPSASMVEGLDAREALALANKWGTKEKGVTSFVDTKNISFEFENGDKTSVPLPDQKMVVAIAPYLTYTHPCENHYMSGCQGEMANVPVEVYGKTQDGLVVVDKTITTLDNGFIELWLARDLEITLTMEVDGKRSTRTITTNQNSNTCITTMQLL